MVTEKEASISARIKELMTKQGISVKQLAERMHKKPAAIYGWITPGRTLPKLVDIEELASFLNVSAEYIITGTLTNAKETERLMEIINYQKDMLQQYQKIVEKLTSDLISPS